MSNRICKKCGSVNVRTTKYSNGGKCYVCEDCYCVGISDDFPEQSLFDTITASLEVLAEKLVYPTYGIISRTWDFEKDDWGTAEPSWSSTILPHDLCFATKEDAIAATVARLKEVEK